MLFLLLVFIVTAAVFVLRSYNSMRNLTENLKESLSNISVVASKKISLVNQLINIVQNYQESEKFVMLQVSTDTVQGVQDASARSGVVMADIGRVTQKFPDIKSNVHYLRLMDAMQGTEQELQNARTGYNHNAKMFNTARTSIPTIFYANALGFGEAQYLSIGTVEDPSLKIQQQMISDDANRVNVLLNKAGRATFNTAKQLGQQGLAIAQRGNAKTEESTGVPSHFAFCPQCGQRNELNGAFCADCGHKFQAVSPVA